MKIKLNIVFLSMLAGWINRQQQEAINYLLEENRIIKEKYLVETGKKRIILNDNQRRRLAILAKKLGRGEVILCRSKSFKYDLDNFSSDLKRANNKAGLKRSYLDFRHTFSSILAMKGESLYKISTLMGNLPEICRRHYAALIPETMTDSVEFSQVVNKCLRAI